MGGQIARSLVACSSNGNVDLKKFYQYNPLTPQLEKQLHGLAHQGYISIDYRDNSITAIAVNQKLIDLMLKEGL